MTKVELFEAIRRDNCIHGKSIREIARERGVHRRTVRQALGRALPPSRRRPQREAPVLTAALQALVDGWLREDATAPRKQRHTGARIFARLRAEAGYAGAASTVRRYVGRRRRELAGSRAVFVPLVHEPGEEAEVDWYEAEVQFPWGREDVGVLLMRACYHYCVTHSAVVQALDIRG
jgi:transposase